MEPGFTTAYLSAIDDFRNARRAAMVSGIFAGLQGRENNLLSFEEIRKKLKLETTSNRQYLADIPLDAIVGSVNRYEDFTRNFLPKKDNVAERWAKVSAAMQQNISLPPIEVFKIGEVYFVNDGNHRVSVARQMGNQEIQAYVTEIKSRVSLRPDEKPEDLIIKAELAEFLERTRLDLLRPGADFSATAPEAYDKLMRHLAIHHYFMNVDQSREVPEEEATLDWYDNHFLPTITLISESGLLREFPQKTPVDLYIWLLDHRTSLEKWLGKEVDLSGAARHIIVQHGTSTEKLTSRLKDAVLPDGLERPIPRQDSALEQSHTLRDAERLFSEILVPIEGPAERWPALEQAVIVAQKESARLYGLHVTDQPEDPGLATLAERFSDYSQANGVQGELNFTKGETARVITHQAAWQDLIVINLNYRPSANPLSRLTHGFRVIVQRSPCPVLVVPRAVSPIAHAMLAYDGSEGAREALFVATYIGARWGTRLSILTVEESVRQRAAPIAAEAQEYAQTHQLEPHMLTSSLPASQAIMHVAEQEDADLIIMGGFSRAPLVGILFDTIADQVLRKSQVPMLLCR